MTGIADRRNLVRTDGGRMIHRAECRYAQRGGAAPWYWADDVTATQLHLTVRAFGYRTCSVCRPLGGDR